MTTNIIPFYSHKQEYGFLSQFYVEPFYSQGIVFNCAEKYMMSIKALIFGDLEAFYLILSIDKPSEIKKLGRLIKNFDEETWDENKQKVVYLGNLLKFSQNPGLANQLIDTGDSYLVEATPNDLVWGNGLTVEETRKRPIGDWPGQNLLGKTLMKVRDVLR